jgi:hypothetical protein
VKTNITAAKDQTGIDGVANAASSLTATDDNGTCIQTITLAAGNRTGSVYLKRLTGTGNVQVTLDGSTYSTIELSDTEWYRIVLSGSVTNPTVGIKIVVDGDAVAMDYGQVEDGLFASTPILTTTATATRAVDSASNIGINFSSWYKQNEGTFLVESFVSPNKTNGTYFCLTKVNNNGQPQISIDQLAAGSRFFYFNANLFTPSTATTNNGETNQPFKASLSFSLGNSATAFNGKIAFNSSLVVPIEEFITLRIGITPQQTIGYANTSIKRLIFIPKRLTNNTIEELTK